VRRREDLFVGRAPIYVCPNNIETFRTTLSTCLTPIHAVVTAESTKRLLDVDTLVQARQAYYRLETFRDSLEECFVGCPKSCMNPWQQFLHWVAAKMGGKLA